jgi:hypothetical protein
VRITYETVTHTRTLDIHWCADTGKN